MLFRSAEWIQKQDPYICCLQETHFRPRDPNTPLTPTDRSSKQKINKETQALNDTIDQVDLTDIYRTFHLKVAEYPFFSSAHGIFSRIDHILGHRSSLGKFKKTEIV